MKLGQVSEKKRKFGEENWDLRKKVGEKDGHTQPNVETTTIHEHDALKNETGTEVACNPKGNSDYYDECGRVKRLKRSLDQ